MLIYNKVSSGDLDCTTCYGVPRTWYDHWDVEESQLITLQSKAPENSTGESYRISLITKLWRLQHARKLICYSLEQINQSNQVNMRMFEFNWNNLRTNGFSRPNCSIIVQNVLLPDVWRMKSWQTQTEMSDLYRNHLHTDNPKEQLLVVHSTLLITA